MNDYVIEARSVEKTLGRGAGEVQALRGIDLSLRRGELTLLMGPSGSGKTTLLLVLGCMLTPNSGSVTVCGTPTSNADKEALARIRVPVLSSVPDADRGPKRATGAGYSRRARQAGGEKVAGGPCNGWARAEGG